MFFQHVHSFFLSHLSIQSNWNWFFCMLAYKLYFNIFIFPLISVQFSCSLMSDSLRPHESQHTRPPYPSPSPEFTQTHVHWVSDAIQPSHPQLSPSPPAPKPSQHKSLFQWVNSSHEVAKVLEFQLQHHSFQRNPRADLLQDGLVVSPCGPIQLHNCFDSIYWKAHSLSTVMQYFLCHIWIFLFGGTLYFVTLAY